MSTLNERNPNVDFIPIGSVASGTTVVVPGLYFRKHSRIKNVYYVDAAAIGASGSAYLAVQLQDNSGTPVVYASGNTKAGIAAVTQLPLTLASPDSDSASQLEQDVPAGTMLNAQVVSNSTAVSTKAGLLVEWYPL